MLLFRLGSLVFTDVFDFICALVLFMLLAVLLFFFIKSCVAQRGKFLKASAKIRRALSLCRKTDFMILNSRAEAMLLTYYFYLLRSSGIWNAI